MDRQDIPLICISPCYLVACSTSNILPPPPAPPPNLPLGFLPFQRICDSITNFLEPLRGRRWATKHPIYFNLPRIFSFKLNEWIQVKNSSNFSKNKFPIFKWFNSIFLKRMKRFIFEKRPLIDGRKKSSTWSISATTSFHAGVWHLFISGQGPFFTADVGSFFRPLTVGHQWKHQTLGIFFFKYFNCPTLYQTNWFE